MKPSQHLTNRLKELLESPEWSIEDREWLLQYLEQTDHPELKHLFQERFEKEQLNRTPHPDAERLLSLIHQKIEVPSAKAKLVFANWKKLLVAASVVLLAGAAIFIYQKQRGTGAFDVVKKDKPSLQADIAPGHNAATLILGDGSAILLDSTADGALAEQGNVKVLKLDGKIAYSPSKGATSTELLYNTIATTNGNQYQLILADGSKVWLNAASSLRFPAAFTGKERRVEITGEAYFEVAKNAGKPFIVQVQSPSGIEGEIEVLGTHFNIDAYKDEAEVRTTLLEGSVKVKKAGALQMLAPGEQAKFNSGSKILLQKNVDLAHVMAWKDGYFWFNNTDIHTLMKQIARWYDIEVAFEGKVTEEGFSGKISRSLPLSKLLKVLELNDVHFKREGKKITVLP